MIVDLCVEYIQLFSKNSFGIHTHLLNLAISIPFLDPYYICIMYMEKRTQ